MQSVFIQMFTVVLKLGFGVASRTYDTWIMLATHRKKLEERILEDRPLLILVSNHWNIDFAEVLREQ